MTRPVSKSPSERGLLFLQNGSGHALARCGSLCGLTGQFKALNSDVRGYGSVDIMFCNRTEEGIYCKVW